MWFSSQPRVQGTMIHPGCEVTLMLQVYQMKRQDAEKRLRFAGFLVISCPLKHDSKHNVQCLLDSSHYVSE